MRLWVVRRGKGLEPYGDESVTEFAHLPFEKPLQVDVAQPRNPGHHRLFWALCARIGRGIGKDAEWVARALKVETGHFDVYRYRGRENLVLRSIAFGKMDEIQFSKFINDCCDVVYRVWKIEPASVADLLVPQEEQKRD